jgi:TPP-dependent pyruvate/acetoin dehydrogenase alpha subunit
MEATETVRTGTSEQGPSPDEVLRVLGDDGQAGTDPGVDRDTAIAIYRAMVRARAVDEEAELLKRDSRIGFHVPARGEEAAIIGSAAALRERDWLVPSYREHGAAFYRGFSLEAYFDQLLANSGDGSNGRQMPGLCTSRALRIVSSSPLSGTQIPHAVGLAWAAKSRGEDLVSAVFFGEAATSTEGFHTGLNFAGVFGAPVVLLCRNNRGASAGSDGDQTATETFAEKAVAYGVAGRRVDGNDALACYRAVREAIDRASAGGGPTLIELLTHRLDSEASAADPMARLRRYLEGLGAWDEARERAFRDEVKAEIASALDAAVRKEPAALATLFSDVYGERPWHLREQERELEASPRAPRGRR